MALDLWKEKGTPLDRQVFTWREMAAGPPISKLDVDAFTRVRVILMNGIESEAIRFSHVLARASREARLLLARIRRVEQHQQTLVNWLLPADQSPLETTIGYEQVAIEVTASIALNEPDPYLAQTYRFGLLEDFDHMYRYAALLDRLEGKDANNILHSYTDILPGRPTVVEHRAPEDDLRRPYDRKTAAAISKLNAMTLVAGEYQTHDYYMHVGPLYSDPVARMLYAEIASIEEQHVTQYESLADPDESWLEKWLLHEATEVYNYWSCAEQETDPRIKSIWTRFVDYELGHLQLVKDLFEKTEKRDAQSVLPSTLATPIEYKSHRAFVRQTLAAEVDLRARGTDYIRKDQEPAGAPSVRYREQLNSDGSPSEVVAAGYRFTPGTELAAMSAEGKEHPMSTAPTETGRNRTGISLSPVDGKSMTEAAERAAATPGSAAEAEAVRRELSENAPPRGTVPPPATVKGLAKTAVGMVKGEHLAVFIDLIGERLAFERSGVRLYQALRVKCEAAAPRKGGPTIAELEQFEAEELSHFALLVRACESLGADPTVITPSADVVAVASSGLVQLLGDPRTTLTEGLRGILIAELTDNDGWRILTDLAVELKQSDLAREFSQALTEEEEHLDAVRRWLSLSIFEQAGAEPPPAHPSH